MRLYNSLTNKIEEFKSIKENEVTMYVCGPTVYGYIHIGNARPVIFFDILKNYLEFSGYSVKYASNITDVDDRIIKKALESNQTEAEVTKKYIEAFWKNVYELGSKKPTLTPMATEYINEMIEFISKLVEKGSAYEVDGDVYFRVSKVKSYGCLSNQNTDELNQGARILVGEKKESALDFTLWKKTNEGIMWDSPWGPGRPGWHTECVVMINSLFNDMIDIHGGGVDLKFPHHENEIAQSEALFENKLAKYWMHVGRLDFGKEKMSKSLGNVILVNDLLKSNKANAYRLLIIGSNYRQPINYSNELMEQYSNDYEKIERAYKQAFLALDLADGFTNEYIEEDIKNFKEQMDNDMNTANVITIIYDLVKRINAATRSKDQLLGKLFATLKLILDVLGIKIECDRLSNENKALYLAWLEARSNKNFKEADELRAQLTEKGII